MTTLSEYLKRTWTKQRPRRALWEQYLATDKLDSYIRVVEEQEGWSKTKYINKLEREERDI